MKSKFKIPSYRTLLFILSVFAFHGSIMGQADFEQTDDEDGLVIIETENFSSERTATDGSSWEPVTEPANFSGSGAMQAYHADGADFILHKTLEDAQVNAPVLQYTVNFVKAEPVYAWARASHEAGYDDSVWPGLDGVIVGTSEQSLTYLTEEQEYTDWYYINHGMDNNRFVMDIATTGEKVFELYYRETYFIVDQIILTTNADYDPNASSTAISEYGNTIELSQIYPNPVQDLATIQYCLSQAEFVTLKIFNANGQEIESLVNKYQSPGNYEITWNAEGLSNGLYYYQIQVGIHSKAEKFILQ